jgi:CRISPR-associated endonuclease Csn1
MSIAGVKRTLKLKGAALSLEATGSGELIGDRTSTTMRKAFGEHWDSMSESERTEALLDVHSYEKGEALAARATTRWRLSDDSATALVDASLEPGYASLSTHALSQLLPLLETGLNSREAMDRAFPGRFSAQKEADRLAPVQRVLGDIRNPVVMRSLTEVRRIVNGVLRRWGRPVCIRIELARDIKRGRRERERMAKENRGQEKLREQASEAIIKESSVVQPRRSDIEKFLLAEECGFMCPYTGRKFGMADLFGDSPSVDVEHIIPYSRSLDDSFANKTLCDVEENRRVKKQQTPFEAYSGDPERWAAIMERVKKFAGRSARAKIERFELPHVGEELIEQFSSRQLNDTRYASRLAAAYVGQLYGGTVDSSGTQRVQVSAGGVTARLRHAWRVGRALHDDGEKNREDHRHHALDAIAVAMASPRVVRLMALAASRGTASGRDGKLLDLPLPWERFIDDVKAAISEIVVSHRVDRRLTGPLHEESNYSRPLKVGGTTVHRLRKPISAIDEKKAEGIPDPRVRETVISAVRKSGKLGLSDETYPVARKIGGMSERVRRVRLPAPRGPIELGSGASRRWVSPGGNHHMAIYAAVVEGKESWEAEVVTRIEAYRRWRAGEPVVRKTRSDGAKLVFTLRGGDCIAMKDREGIDQWYVIATITGDKAEVRRHNDARSSKEIRKPGTTDGRRFVSVRQLKELGAQRFDLDPLGLARTAHD